MGIGRRLDQAPEPTPSAVVQQKVSSFTLSKPKHSFADLILPQATQDQINRALAFRQHHDLVFREWGLSETHRHARRVCLNFFGPPGTGKTMAAHAVAHSLGQDLLVVNYADIESKYVGETPKNLVAVFRQAEQDDAIIFFDEADALLSRRVTNMNNATDTSVNQTRSVLLNILNDYDKTILFATNFIENFDPAFMRRILAHVEFGLPDLDCRRRLYRTYLPKSMPGEIDIEAVAARHEGLSGSDIANAVLLAAFAAAERRSNAVTTSDIEAAVQSILASRKANAGRVVTTTREVSKEYAEQALGVNT